MESVIFKPNSIGSLGPWDTDAANTVYGAGPVCNAPQVTTQPSSQSITSGNHANLSVVASGTPTLTYQWYVGTSGTTTSPVNGATSTTFTPSPTTTTSYWVRVSNSCNGVQHADSNTAVVTVTCSPPTAPAPVASPSSIAFGQSSSLSEAPTGTGPFTYQWYVGASGTTTSPIGGATNSSVTVSPASTTSYWVRVGGACAPTADSPATSVTVAPCVPPSTSAPFASPSSIPTGQSSTLSVSPSGTSPFTYQWYIGSTGDTRTPINGATNSFVTVSPTVTTAYWVRVTGQCAPFADSAATTVTVTCAPISGSPNASPNPINSGQSSTLSVNTTGAGPFTFQWYNGNLGDTSSPIAGATGSSTIVSPTSSSFYWVRVTAGCGSQDASLLVTVNGICNAPAITTQPASSPQPVAPNTPVTLSVAASGTAPFTYQWFIGDKGDVSHLIAGATAFSMLQSPAVTTKYWVRVSNSCNGTQSADSNAATITVSTCTNPSITTQPANVSTPIGEAATLHVVAAGSSLHYAWFKGAKGDTSKPTGAADSATFVSGAISGNTTFWVRVSGACGSPVDSNAATVTATAPPRGRAARH
jgi:large repetitive protein